ncbi:hypothetical protein EGW08_009742, partial [Elysia chlorotica]
NSNNSSKSTQASHSSDTKQVTQAGQDTSIKQTAASTKWAVQEATEKEQETKKSGPASKPRVSGPAGVSSNRSSSRRHICQSCELVFPSGMDLLLHRYEQHSLVCKECDSRFLSGSGLLRHKETDHPPINRCPHCRFVTFNKEEFNTHISQHKIELKENSEDSEYLSHKQEHKDQAHSASSTKTVQTTKRICKADPSYGPSLNSVTHEFPETHYAKTKFHSLPKQEEKLMVSTKDVKPNSVSCNPLSFGMNEGDGGDCLDSGGSDGGDNGGSESEEPCLVIDTAECGNFDRKEEFTDSRNNDEQPLCLVVHTRENKNVDKNASLTDKYKEDNINSFLTAEVEGENSPPTYIGGKRNIKLQRSDEVIVFPNNRREGRTTRKRRSSSFSSTLRNDVNADLSSSSADCLTHDNSSLETTCADCWSSEPEIPRNEHALDKPDETSAENLSGSTEDRHKKNVAPVFLSCEDKPLHHRNWTFRHNAHREPVLRDRHTTNSLPPKKRGFRKSPRHHNVNSSTVGRSLRGSSLVEKQQDKSNLSLSSNQSLKADAEGTQNSSPTCELDESSNNKGVGTPPLSISACHVSKAHKRKQALSKKSHKRYQTQSKGKSRGSEAVVFGKTEVKVKEERQAKACSARSTEVQKPLHASKSSCGKFKCPMAGCGASFSRKWSMEVHLERVHMKDGHQLMCHVPLCPSKFSSRRELRRHVVEGHQGKVRRYPCSWPACDKSFFARTHLRTHLLVHTGEKPLACEICDYRCRQRTALIWHMRKHGLHDRQMLSGKEDGKTQSDGSI